MPLQAIYDYFQNWDAASFEVFTQMNAEPAEAEVAAIESQAGFRLPDEFREYAVHPLGGLYMAVREDLWPRPQAYQVGPAWTFLYGLMVFSFCSQAPDWLQLRRAWQRMAKDGHNELVPFLRIIGDADRYCFTANQKIVIWRHETPNEPEEISETFSEVLMREIQALENRKNRKIQGEDKKPIK